MINKCFLEITNICNLNCIFCPKNERPKRRMTEQEFDLLTDKLQGQVRFLYFHLMGEPVLHPLLPTFIAKARAKGFIPIVTTNGTLLTDESPLLEGLPYKMQISLHSHEGNGRKDLETYIRRVLTFSLKAAERGCIVILRLWNQGGYEEENALINELLTHYCPQPWEDRYDGYKLKDNLYLENDTYFEWPTDEHERYDEQDIFCYGLRNQIGILVDGTVVPCCMDHEGALALGNLHTASLSHILSSPRARAIFDGFTHHRAVEPLCQKCGFVRRRL